MEEAAVPIKKAMSNLADAMGNMTDMFDEYQRLSNSMNYALKEMDLAINKFNSGKEKINKALEILKDSINELDIKMMLEDIRKGTMDINEFIENLGLNEVDLQELIQLLEKIRENVYVNIDYILKLIEVLRNEEVLNLLKLAWEDVEEALEHIDNAVETIDDVNRRIENIIDSMRDTSSNMEKALDFMVEAMDIMKKAESDINFILEEVNKLVEYISSQAPLKFQTTDENYQRTKENLFDSIRKILSSFSNFKDKLNYQSNIMIEDIELINSQMFKVINLILDIFEELNMDNVDIEDVIKDVSREDVDKTKEGKVFNCRNLGTIEGDINVGGIAGAMSIEIELDPEWDMDLKDRISVNAVYQTRAIIMESQNEGDVISKKNYVGGIVGKMDIGYITNAISSGLIKSKDGNYVGGIAGASSSFIDSSYAKCQLEGGNYIGGIAGYGKEIKDSYSLVKVNRCKAYVGAIAGKVDENSNIERNYFVSDILNGIDGISYENKAEPIEYETLISKENIPSLFKKFKLTFWVDDKLVDSIEFNYGDSIPESLIPDVPQKEGYYGVWEEFNNEELKFDLAVKAVYSPYITAIESREKRDDGLAIILVEGNFTEEDILEIKELDKEDDDNENFIEKWNVKIPEDGNYTHIIRYYPPKNIGDLDILVLKNGEWIPMKVQWDGKYMIFEVDGNSINFAVIKNYDKCKYIFILALIVLIVITIHIVRKRKIKD